jgi:hypothetical protein
MANSQGMLATPCMMRGDNSIAFWVCGCSKFAFLVKRLEWYDDQIMRLSNTSCITGRGTHKG